MSDVYLMLGLGLDQCSETQDYLSSGRPMQLVGHNADSWYWWWLFAYIQLLEKKENSISQDRTPAGAGDHLSSLAGIWGWLEL